MLKYKLYLNDILKSIREIEKSIGSKSKKYFDSDIDASKATAMRLQVIGESIKKIPLEIKSKFNLIDWDKIADLRNIISHAYFKINNDMLWEVVGEDLPLLKKVVLKITSDKKYGFRK